jgi:putative ABC transport system permease protein
VTLPDGASLASEAQLARAIARAHPTVTAMRVKDAIEAFNVVFGKVMVAVRSAGSVTLVAGALVLAGALATAQRRRIKQAVILKTLGATRRRVLATHGLEYLMLAAITAVFAAALGSAASWVAVTQVMEIDFTFSIAAVLLALGLATGLVLAFGAVGTWHVLRAPALPYLRAE